MNKKINTKNSSSKKHPKNNTNIHSRAGELNKRISNSFVEIKEKINQNNFDCLKQDGDFEKNLSELCACVYLAADVDMTTVNTLLNFLKDKLINLTKNIQQQVTIHKEYAKKLYDFTINIDKKVTEQIKQEQQEIKFSFRPLVLINIKEVMVAAGYNYIMLKSTEIKVFLERIVVCNKIYTTLNEIFELSTKMKFSIFMEKMPSFLSLEQNKLQQEETLSCIERIFTAINYLKNQYINLLKCHKENKSIENLEKGKNTLCKFIESRAAEFKEIKNNKEKILDVCKNAKNNGAILKIWADIFYL